MMIIALQRKALESKRACPEGLRLFDAIKARQDDVRAKAGKPPRKGCVWRWTRLHVVWMAVAYPGFLAWMVQRDLFPIANLGGAYLEGAYLEGAYLEGAYLEGAYLEGAYLEGAYLKGANLVRANLRGAYLRGAYLEGAYLEGAYLKGAYLVRANLEGAYWGDHPPPAGWRLVNGRLTRD